MRAVQFALVFLLLVLAVPAAGQTPLPMATPASGTATSNNPAVYTVRAETAGVLSVAVEGTGDLTLTLTDADGQSLPQGSADRDLNGSTGTEILSVTIGVPGDYRVVVGVFGGEDSAFEIAGSFLMFPPFEQPADPDGRPSQALVLEVGAAHENTLDTEGGDQWDWFVFMPSQDATLAIVTRAVDGNDIDLELAVFLDGNFAEPIDSSDQDQQGDTANEGVTVAVTAGQNVHVRVSSVGAASGPYQVASSLIGNAP